MNISGPEGSLELPVAEHDETVPGRLADDCMEGGREEMRECGGRQRERREGGVREGER